MLSAWFIATALIAASPATDASTPADLAASYREARAKAGRTPEDQVNLALWCEARGLTSERLKHLSLAILADPGNAAARGLMGYVSYQGRWLRPEDVAAKAKVDPILVEYESRRAKAPYTAEAQWNLGVWADEHGLREQARAHLSAVTKLDPTREAAWKRLGYRKIDGRWKTDARAAAEKAEIEAQRQADRTYPALLAGWRDGLTGPEKRAEAEKGLDDLIDPRAVGAVVRVFGNGGPQRQVIAVRLLSQIDCPASSRALACLATWGKTVEVRRASAEVLAHRDPREFAGLLIGGFRQVVRYELGTTPNANGEPAPYFAIEGKNYDFVLGSTLPVKFPEIQSRSYATNVPYYHAGGLGAAGFAAAEVNAIYKEITEAARLRDLQVAKITGQGAVFPPRFKALATAMMAEIDDFNASATRDNAAIYAALGMITGKDLPMDPERWKAWWVDSLGYSYKVKSSVEAAGPDSKPVHSYTITSCFAAGTPVRTITGDRSIETLKVGDQVLSQDTATGALRYRSIAAVLHNPPALALRVNLGDEVILATGFHRFWMAGKGWIMARELKPGDTLRTLDGLKQVTSVEPDRVQPVFNLDVADDADYFVGKLGALVHDNTLPDPRVAPFDAAKR